MGNTDDVLERHFDGDDQKNARRSKECDSSPFRRLPLS